MEEKHYGVKNYNLYLQNGKFVEIYFLNGEHIKGKITGAYLDVILIIEANGTSDPRVNSLLPSQNPVIIQRGGISLMRILG